MTPFYEGWARSHRTINELTRPTRPIDEIVVRPSVGYRIGRSLVHFGAHLMGERVTTRSDLELAA